VDPVTTAALDNTLGVGQVSGNPYNAYAAKRASQTGMVRDIAPNIPSGQSTSTVVTAPLNNSVNPDITINTHKNCFWETGSGTSPELQNAYNPPADYTDNAEDQDQENPLTPAWRLGPKGVCQ
jgi:hypothetical protein